MSVACSKPFLTFPGQALQGIESEAASWEFARQFTILQLETRPEDPYSVYLQVIVKNGQLYIDAASQRRWHDHIKQNPAVRIKLGDFIYPASAIQVTAPEELQGFISGRTIYRLEHRPARH